jgi:hypothetical protein
MIAADGGVLRATSLETELARSNDELERLGMAAGAYTRPLSSST